MHDRLQCALKYRRRGLQITLCPPNSKKPLGKGWNKKYNGREWPSHRWSEKKIAEAFKVLGELNVGVRLGPQSNIIDFECDGEEAEQSFNQLFEGVAVPKTPTFQSTRGKHRLFAWNRELERLGKAEVRYGALELRLGANDKGAHSLLPPSTTDGFTRRWLIPIDECKPAQVPDTVIQRLIASLGLQNNNHPTNTEGRIVNTETQAIAYVSKSLCNPSDPAIRDAVAQSLPSAKGHRHRRIFYFVRKLKAIPSLAGADHRSLRPIVQEWHQQALPRIGTKSFDETWADFGYAWHNAKYPAGDGPIMDIYRRALIQPLPSIAQSYETPTVKSLIALCRELQRSTGKKPFFLACRTAGELLGISYVYAAKWLRMLVDDGVLKLVTHKGPHSAAEYRYLSD